MKRMWYAIAVCVLTGCLSPYDGNDNESGLPDTATPVEAVSLLFNEEQKDSQKVTRFYTNDAKYRRPSGYTLWTSGEGGEETPFVSKMVTVRKTSGSSIAGYGMVLCEAPRFVNGVVGRVFLTVMINNNGQYAVGKVTGAVYEPLEWWTPTDKLRKGIVDNDIRVDFVYPNSYDLYFNGVKEASFIDANPPACEGKGRSGYIVVIAPGDLNHAAVEVLFAEAL
jgi:hypothetical protein